MISSQTRDAVRTADAELHWGNIQKFAELVRLRRSRRTT
jgi:hypothetical protein